jgi:Kef-type potassium/proton antiporter, CPA2 family (TC 2.A.37.1)
MAFGYAIGRFFGWERDAALWFGGLISLSSTMVVLKTLMNQGILGTLSSKVMIGMLIVQDLAIVPMVIVLPLMNDPSAGLAQLGQAGLKATVFLASMFLLGAKLLPWLMRHIARLGSRELFLLAIIAIGLGVGYATYLVGLSFAFGAFIAGMVLNESDYGHQALSDIIPCATSSVCSSSPRWACCSTRASCSTTSAPSSCWCCSSAWARGSSSPRSPGCSATATSSPSRSAWGCSRSASSRSCSPNRHVHQVHRQ